MPRVYKAPELFIGLFTEDGLDQTTYSIKDAKRERKDLQGMGLTVKPVFCKGSESELFLDALNDLVRSRNTMPTASAINKTLKAYPTVTVSNTRL